MSQPVKDHLMRYELATLDIKAGMAGKAMAGIDAFLKEPDAKGQLLGCWTSDIGDLNQIIILRSFADDAEMQTERMRVFKSANPFHCGEMLTGMSLEGHAPFPFMPPVTTGTFGKVYEIRRYRLKTGGLLPSIAAWEAAVPQRITISPLVIVMHTLDGPPRFTHIWPYTSLDGRSAKRAEAVATGNWPPRGGAEWLADMRSTIAIPAAFSPLA
jgi:NIPSNAP